MPPSGSQTEVLVSASEPFPLSPSKTRQADAFVELNARPAKRPRLMPSQGKENIVSRRAMGISTTKDEEKMMMNDLLAGLDASAFEAFEVSPVKPKPRRAETRVPLVVKLEAHGPGRSVVSQSGPPDRQRSRPPSPIKAFRALSPLPALQIKSEVKVKLEAKNPSPRNPVSDRLLSTHAEMADVGKLKPDEEDVFRFDLDLADLADFDDIELSRPPPPIPRYPLLHPDVPLPPEGYRSTPWMRCKVEAVFDGLRFMDGVISKEEELASQAGPSAGCDKTLVVIEAKSLNRHIVHLKERWADTSYAAGDIVNVISPDLARVSALPTVITFKDPSSFLIHHPDLMLTMTSIANAMPCPRKPILQSLVKVSGPPSKAILYGTIQHGLLQSSLSEQSFDEDVTRRRLDEELKKEERRLEVWGAGMNAEDIKIDLGTRAGRGFEVFGRKWIGPEPSVEGELHSTPGDDPSLLAINGLHDVEEDIWSPKWGLKGKVDASVQSKIVPDPRKTGGTTDENVAPLEIKTGRAVGVMTHRAQTMMYTLLMEDRYGVPVPAGLLYYSQLDSILRVEAKANEIRALIIARNELAGWLAKKRKLSTPSTNGKPPGHVDVEDAFLPPTIDNLRECRSCYAIDTCMLYRKTWESAWFSGTDPIAELYEEKTGHLSEKDAAFFKKWDTLVTVEEQELGRFRSQLWTMTAKEREKTGRCFSDMVIESYSSDLGRSLAKIHRHTYVFVRSTSGSSQHHSLLSGHIAKGDPVNLSIEPDLLCLSRGFVTDLTPERIVIGVSYVIDTAALLKRTSLRGLHQAQGDVRFRIDKDEMAGGMMRMRNNLAQLFFANGDEKRRGLIVDLKAPYFEPARAPLPEGILTSLNSDQRRAMDKVLTARDYAIILGMPGTGKTTTIAEIIKALVERGKSVLLTSYTHSAVDTILMKLLNADFGILRLGNVDKVHPDVQHLTLEALDASKSMTQMDQRLMGPPIVAATCLAIDHPLFFRRKFDYCIVDEASQITLPTCLGPLRMADTFVLVGDHFQLPPIVKSADARRGGLDVSLFRLLSEAHPSAVVDLSYQYRMNEDIMLLSNHLIYEGRLKCGNEEVARQALRIPERSACSELHPVGGLSSRASIESSDGGCWVQDLMDDNVKAVFVDTDLVPALDSKVGDLVQNPTEAKLVCQLAMALTSSGVKQEDIAVITPYRQQIKLLTGLFANLPKIEILTADKSQGRDKECILISLVRSNEVGNIGDLLRDWRRINVSFTRAKRKLVIFGSRRTLQTDCLLAGFFRLMEDKGWIYALPRGADGMHPAPEVTEVVSRSRSMPEAEITRSTSISGQKIGEKDGVKKEKAQVTEHVDCALADKEERRGSHDGGKKGIGRLGERVLQGRPFVKEVLAEINGLT